MMNMKQLKYVAMTVVVALSAMCWRAALADTWTNQYNVITWTNEQGIAWHYTIDNGEACVGSGQHGLHIARAVPYGTVGEVAIPSELGGCPVTGIGEAAFYGCTNLTGVVIPDTVRKIGDLAFYKSPIKSVKIGSNVLTIGKASFHDCRQLRSVEIPDSVTSLGSGAFALCTSLRSLSIGNGLTNINYRVHQSVFWGTGNFTYCGKSFSTQTFTIQQNPFESLSSLVAIKFGTDIQAVNWYVFDGIKNLKYVYFPGALPLRSKTMPGVANRVCYITHEAYPDGLPNPTWSDVPLQYYDGNFPSEDVLYDLAFAGPQAGADGLVAYYKFNGDATDSSGYGNDGATQGVALTQDRHGNANSAYYFDGASHIEVPNSSSLSGVGKNVTCSVWIKPEAWDSIADEWMVLLCKGESIPSNIGFSIWKKEGLELNAYNSHLALPTLPELDKWQMLTYTSDGTTVKYYVNGVCIASTNWTITAKSNTSPLLIGKDPPGDLEYFKGAMDEVRIYNRALSDAEVYELYAFGEDAGTVVQIHSPGAGGIPKSKVLQGDPVCLSYRFQDVWGIGAVVSKCLNRVALVKDPSGDVVGATDDITNPVDAGQTVSRTGLELPIFQNLECGTYRATLELNADGALGETDYSNNTNTVAFTVVPSVEVTFSSEGNTVATRRYGAGDPYGTFTDPPIREGFRFVGWFTDEEGGDAVTASSIVPDLPITLYAHWDVAIQETLTVGGTLASGETKWLCGNLYKVTSDLVVPSGATLTIEPGVIVKFAAGKSLTVNNGGTLKAIGTRALPIVFTSIKDDANGGDTNGDGIATEPQAGDWHQIKNNGTANIEYAKVLYCSAVNNQGALYPCAGTMRFKNSTVAHCQYDCMRGAGGIFIAENSVFTDASMGAAPQSGKSTFVNCVFYSLTTAVRWGNGTFANCIFADVAQDIIDTKFYSATLSSKFSNCCFWNPEGTGDRAAAKVGKDGNFYANPLFVNPANGDFRIAANSPCVDAGDGSVAPERDYYGLERRDVGKVTDSGVPSANGNCPDIGIHEVLWDEDESPYDIAPTAVSVDKTKAKVGDKVKVSWTIQNLGTEDVVGGWHDAVSLVSTSGQSVELGEVLTTYTLKRKMSMNVNRTFTIPALSEGTWYARVNTNNRRSDVPEGLNTTNNVLTSVQGVAISVAATPYADGASGTLSAGSSTVVKFTFPAVTTGQIARVSVPAGLSVSYGLGFMPQGAYASGTMTATENGEALFHVPAGTTEVYLVMDAAQSEGQNYSVSFEDGDLAITSVSPNTVPSSGSVSITINGAGFDQDTTVSFVSGSSVMAAQNVRYVSAEQLVATFNGSEWSGGNTVSIRLNGGTAEFANAFTVANTQGSADLVAKLDVPSSVRAGRSCVGYVEYENRGNCDMAVPVFEIVSQGQIFKVGGKSYTNSVKIVGLSDNEPRGVLRPGEPQRLSFEVAIGNSSDSVRWQLNSYSELQASASESVQLETLLDPDWVYYHSQHTNNNLYAATKTAFGATWRDFYRNLGNYVNGKIFGDGQTVVLDDVVSVWAMSVYLDVTTHNNAPKKDVSMSATLDMCMKKASDYEELSFDEADLPLLEEARMDSTRRVSYYDQAMDYAIGWYYQGAWYDVSCSVVRRRLTGMIDKVLVICHGHRASILDDWISSMAHSAMQEGYSAVLAIDWSRLAGCVFPRDSAPHIPRVAEMATYALHSVLGIQSQCLTLVGHSHGGHIVAEIADGFFQRSGVRVKRVVGLDTSPMSEHQGLSRQRRWPVAWHSQSADRMEFFKSSWTYSMGELDASEIFGQPSFFVSQEGDFYQGVGDLYRNEGVLSDQESLWGEGNARGRHGYSHDWFAANFNAFGKRSFDSTKWRNMSGLSCEIPKEMYAGVIRNDIMECGGQVKSATGAGIDWRYEELMFKDTPADSMVKLNAKIAFMSEYGLKEIKLTDGGGTVVSHLETGTPYVWQMAITNYADNLSIPYDSDNPVMRSCAPWNRGICNKVIACDISEVSPEGTNIVREIEAASYVTTNMLARLKDSKVKARFADIGVTTGRDAFLLPTTASDITVGQASTTSWEKPFPASFPGRARVLGVGLDNKAIEGGEKFLVFYIAGGSSESLSKLYRGDLYYGNNVKVQSVYVELKGPTAEISFGENKNDSSAYWLKSFLHEIQPAVEDKNNYEADDSGYWSIDLSAAQSKGGTTNIVNYVAWNCSKGAGVWGVGRDGYSNAKASGWLPKAGDDFVPSQTYKVKLTVEDVNGLQNYVEEEFTITRKPKRPPPDPEDEKGSKKPKSCDPNEMVGPEGTGEARYVQPGEWMNYTIYFENKANATAAAQEVFVTNPLSEWLDWSTFEMGAVSFNNQIDIGLSGLCGGMSEVQMSGTNYAVRTFLSGGNGGDGVVATSGVAHWYMRIVDNSDETTWPADPYAGFLPPNDPDTHCGEGHISYRIKVRDDAPRNVIITNSATIVFDYNAPIETDPAWWNTIARIYDVPVEIDGVATNLTLIAGEPFGELPTPTEKRTGYTFDAWYTGENGTGTKATPMAIVPTGEFSLYANWTANPYKVRFNANGGVGTMADQAFVYGTAQKLPANAFTRKMYAFAGWALSPDGAAVYADGQSVGDLASAANSVVALYAVWEKTQNELWPDGVEDVAPTAAASEYNGYLYDEKSGAVKGTIQVKVGKPGKDGKATVKATVVIGTKKVTLKAKDKGKAAINPDGSTEVELVGGEACEIALGAEGLAGYYGAYLIDGSRNFFTSKNKGEVAEANYVLSKWLGSFMVVWDGGSLSVNIAAKGKVKVSGTLADGKTKVSASTMLLVGEEWSCVSVAAQNANLAFVLWLSHDGQTIEAEGLGDNVHVGLPGTLANGATFQIDADEFAAVFGQTMLPYLPDGVPVTQKGTKWTLPKAGKVVYKNGAPDESKLGDNPCGLKLTYKSKDGTFKGSFKVYAEVKGKPKATTVNVTGFMLNGIGYGTATIKKVGSVPISIE